MVIKELITDKNNKYIDTLSKLQEDKNEKILTKDDIISIHEYALNKYGGSNGIRDINLLESVSITPYQEVFGQKLCPSIFDKSARLLYDFADYQIFVDGNKRTGVYCCLTLLAINNYKLTLTNDELYKLTMDIANKRINIDDVKEILQKSSIKLDISQEIKTNKENKENQLNESKEFQIPNRE